MYCNPKSKSEMEVAIFAQTTTLVCRISMSFTEIEYECICTIRDFGFHLYVLFGWIVGCAWKRFNNRASAVLVTGLAWMVENDITIIILPLKLYFHITLKLDSFVWRENENKCGNFIWVKRFKMCTFYSKSIHRCCNLCIFLWKY